ncbi:GIDE domain-containing protein [Fimbriiglobus ruber]|uniref:RING-type E3 ubiquitin transferase n=1 Tax=Fimbriiglobus ruber TaxID=1908690 RepID=A0A225DB41_9BACT|nr:GIDE domain-containing protein [Fimbriiglobus ruber]OWK38682.1 hypothetical protein FRUB_07802 [Fimbriiglobus ruber]
MLAANGSLIPLIFVLVIFLIGGVVFCILAWVIYRSRRRIAAIEGTEASDVADLDEGYAKVRGKVVALEDLLKSPLAGTRCVYFHIKIEEQRTRTVTDYSSGGNNSFGGMTRTRTETYWVTVLDDKQAARCGIEDRTGLARVELLDAEPELNPTAHTQSGLFSSISPRVKRRLEDMYGYSTKGFFFNKTARYKETVIEEGDKLFVIGDVELTRSGKPCFVRGSRPFIVSDKTEAKLLAAYQRRVLWGSIGAVATVVLTIALGAVVGVVFGGGRAGQRQQVAQNDPFNPPGFGGFADPGGQDQGAAINRAFVDLVSPDPGTRERAADALARMSPDPSRRWEVVVRLKMLQVDPDPATRDAVQRALRVWDTPAVAGGPNLPPLPPPDPRPPVDRPDPFAGPGQDRPEPNRVRPGAPRRRAEDDNPFKEGNHYQPSNVKELPPVAVPWTAVADPAAGTFTGAPTVGRGVIPMGFGPPDVVFPLLPSAFVAVYPGNKAARKLNTDGLFQVYDLRTMKAAGGPFRAKTALGEHFVLSPDGAYAAGRVVGGTVNTEIEVIATGTSRSVRRIEAGHDPKEFAFPIGFVSPTRLLTKTHENQLPDFSELTHYKVWDVTTGEEVAHFAYDVVYNSMFCGVSSGGRYLTFWDAKTIRGHRLVVFDLTTGKVVGDVMLQPRSEPHGSSTGMAFSPDGKELAILWRISRKTTSWGKILVYNATTGTRTAELPVGQLVKNMDSVYSNGGAQTIQYTPDGSGWLIFGHLVVNRKTGEVARRIGPEPKWQGEVLPRRFVGPNYLTTLVKSGIDTGLTLEPATASADGF